ncbi:hypothetical protein EMIT0373P_50433 [Pseudomonas chlororaphis]
MKASRRKKTTSLKKLPHNWLLPSNSKTVFQLSPKEAARLRAQPLFKWGNQFSWLPSEPVYKVVF